MAGGLEELLGRVAGRFGRVEPRRHARAFVLGLLADLPRKNCWTIAEHAGDATPDGLRHLLAGAVWDHDAVRDDVRDYLVDHLGDPGAVLVVDETGDLKKGASTVGVARQYTGTAGKVDNAQVAVYLAYATDAGHGVIDRELYLPQGWLADAQRCQVAGVPDRRTFATKPELARVMLARALAAGVPAGWVTADAVYGGSPALRGWLGGRTMPYVLAVKSSEPLPPASGPSAPAARLAEHVPPACWLRISAGPGAKGRRWYGWSCLPLTAAGAPNGWGRWLLVRRSLTTGELAYYLCAGPAGLPLVALVRVAGSRWRVEEAFQAGKGLFGLDQHQVRRWRSWYRWVTLAMLAYAFLVAAVTEHARHPPPLGLIPLTCNELQHLFATLVAAPVADTGHRLRRSWWRRRQQARARACHYRQQAPSSHAVIGAGRRHSRSTMPAQPGGRALALAFVKASPYELRLRRARIRSMATNAMPTVITAIHRAGAPMPATSMTAPMSINKTAIQMKAVMATPPFAPKRRSV